MKNFIIGMVQFATACALVFALYAMLRRGQQDANWPQVQGVVEDTRIVADHSVETKWGGQMTWKAEYRVTYSVASREYTVWVDSGVRGEDKDGVVLALPQSRPTCHVQYNPTKPEAAVAKCR